MPRAMLPLHHDDREKVQSLKVEMDSVSDDDCQDGFDGW